MRIKNGSAIVSIIIPIYNSGQYLSQCLDSVLQQTYKNLQIILIDDGSTDDSASICDAYARRDARIVAIHIKNSGVSAARNTGLRAAVGDFVCFVDSDDYIDPSYAQSLLHAIQSSGADVAVCGLENTTVDGLQSVETVVTEVLGTPQALRRMLLSDGLSEIVVWNKIFDRSLFEKQNLRFVLNKKYSEDVYMMYHLYRASSAIAYIDRILYHYVQRRTGATGQGFNQHWLDSLKLQDDIVEEIRDQEPELAKAAYKFRLRFTLTLVSEICQGPRVSICGLRVLSLWVRLHARNILLNQYVTIGQKMRVLVLMSGPLPYVVLSKIITVSKFIRII